MRCRLSLAAVFLALAACSEDPAGVGVGSDLLGSAVDSGVLTPAPDAANSNGDGGGGGADGTPNLGDGGPSPLDPNAPFRDSDCDGLSDAYEFATVYPGGQRTDPVNPDTDGDGIPDGVEAGATAPITTAMCTASPVDADPRTRTNPTVADSDADGLPDGAEDTNRNGALEGGETNPQARDTDGDGLLDGTEDANMNGQRDPGETNPTARDSDNDGLFDGTEDSNRNGMRDPGETDPTARDTDSDGLADGDEDQNHDGTRQPWESDPRSADTDCDGLGDNEELMGTTNPLVADSDRDGIADGTEQGRTAAVAGTTCPGFVPDADPASTTNPRSADQDMDGVPDGTEDANHNGRVDAGETDPTRADTDGDGLTDGDEVIAGTNPTLSNNPTPPVRDGILRVCADGALRMVSYHVGNPGAWTLAATPSLTYRDVPVTGAATTRAGALDDAAASVSAFVLELPHLAGPTTAVAQTTALQARLTAMGLTVGVRQSPRAITSHDGAETTVSALLEIAAAPGRTTAEVRNTLLASAAGLAPGAFAGLPTTTGASGTEHVAMMQVLVRAAEQRTLVVLAVTPRASYDDQAAAAAIMLADLSNGTALARPDARRGKGCDPFEATGVAIADFVWMADISQSTDDDRGRIVSAATEVFDALSRNGVDFRMGVVPHSQSTIHQPANNGNMRGVGFTRDRAQFVSYLQDASGTDGCEFGIDSVSATLRRALPRTGPGADLPGRVRANATVAVVYVSDENAQEIEQGPCFDMPARAMCPTNIGDMTQDGFASCAQPVSATDQVCVDRLLAPYIQQLQTEGAIAFGQVFAPTPLENCNVGHLVCPGINTNNERGLGYIDVINATGGLYYSPCDSSPGTGPLRAIVDAVTGAASQFQLRGAPISSTIQVGVTRAGPTTTIVPRSRTSGFDYDPASNSIFFRGTQYRPAAGDRVTISYRVWQPPEQPCGPCAAGTTCDPMLGICTCDRAACAACGPNQACDANCQCACAPDCGGNCGPGQACNPTTCACECPADCGGCPSGTTCNPATCACECGADCGGACAGTDLGCNSAACACECPADCGGTCGAANGRGACNQATCACDCAPSCDDSCTGRQVCNPANGCGCECPADCGGCADGTVCNATSCQCECAPTCDDSCGNNRVCDPANGCGCVCPADCGGCGAGERCDQAACSCIPGV
jgi:hypothetical protein